MAKRTHHQSFRPYQLLVSQAKRTRWTLLGDRNHGGIRSGRYHGLRASGAHREPRRVVGNHKRLARRSGHRTCNLSLAKTLSRRVERDDSLFTQGQRYLSLALRINRLAHEPVARTWRERLGIVNSRHYVQVLAVALHKQSSLWQRRRCVSHRMLFIRVQAEKNATLCFDLGFVMSFLAHQAKMSDKKLFNGFYESVHVPIVPTAVESRQSLENVVKFLPLELSDNAEILEINVSLNPHGQAMFVDLFGRAGCYAIVPILI